MTHTSDEFAAAFPSTLDLLEVRVPRTHDYVVDGMRLYFTAVEYWNLWTTFRFVWPVYDYLPASAPLTRQWAWDDAGTQYGLRSYGGTPNGDTYDMHFATSQPVPRTIESITLQLVDNGPLRLDLRPRERDPE
jgi:hypothetical protein